MQPPISHLRVLYPTCNLQSRHVSAWVELKPLFQSRVEMVWRILVNFFWKRNILSQILYFKRKKRFIQNLVFIFNHQKVVTFAYYIYKRVLKILYFHILDCQIWLNMLVDVCCLSNIVELKMKTLRQKH
jgi:hypothetical protein